MPTATDTQRVQIMQVIEQYLAGGRSGRADDMRPVFHEHATVHGYIGGELFGGPIQLLFDWVDGNDGATGIELTDSAVDVANTIATVRLELDNWAGHRFTDQFTLLKIDGQWKIISKVFHTHE